MAHGHDQSERLVVFETNMKTKMKNVCGPDMEISEKAKVSNGFCAIPRRPFGQGRMTMTMAQVIPTCQLIFVAFRLLTAHHQFSAIIDRLQVEDPSDDPRVVPVEDGNCCLPRF